MTIRKKLVNKLNKLMKKDSDEERENRTVKQNRNLNTKIDLEKGRVTENLGSGNKNLPPSPSIKRCSTPAKKRCCLEEKKLRKEGRYEPYGNFNMLCGLVGKECICCDTLSQGPWKTSRSSVYYITTT